MKRRNQDGAIVVEATLSLSFFAFLITAILTMVNVCYTQAQMGILVNGIAKDISNYTYIYTMTDANAKKAELSSKASYANYTASEVLNNSKKVMDKVEILADAVVDPDFWSSMGALFGDAGVSYAESGALHLLCKNAAKNRLAPTGENPDAYLRRLGVKGGLDGLSFFKSELCPGGSDDIRIVVTYQAHMVDFFGLDLNFNLEQTAMTKAWCAIKPSVYRGTNGNSETADSSENGGGDKTGGGDTDDGDINDDEGDNSKPATGEEEKEEEEKEKSVQEWARDSTHNPYSDSVFLGRYIKEGTEGWEYSYDQLGKSNGYSYFSMDSEDYEKLKQEKGLDYLWDINKQFLINQEMAGKTFYLSSSPYNVDIHSTYYMEVEWLESRGYTFEFNEAVGLWKAVRK